MRTGDRTVYKVTRKREECLGQTGSSWGAEMREHAGKRVPLFAQQWDALSVSRPNRKVHPAISRYSGSGFPKQPQSGKRDPLWTKIPGCSFREAHIKEKDPFAEVLVNSRWRGRESRPRCARADRCGAFAPCELRWQTLSRLLSSAPSRGSIPRGSHIKEKDPFAEVLVNSRWRGRESNP